MMQAGAFACHLVKLVKYLREALWLLGEVVFSKALKGMMTRGQAGALNIL